MARFRASEVDNYGGQGGGGFFQLRKNGEVATVRFMYNNEDDVEGLSVHEVKTLGKDGKPHKHYINCLRDYNQPVDDCPFCKAGMFVQAKLFIPIFDVDSGQTKTWERGKKFFGKMSSLCQRYGKDAPLVSHIFEIERHGDAGDTSTFYEVYEVDEDDTTLQDLPPLPSISGLVWDKTAEDMEYFLDEKQFPPTDDDEDEEERPVRRRRTNSDERQSRRRRTPANREEF